MTNRTLVIILGFFVLAIFTAGPVVNYLSVDSTNDFIHKAGQVQEVNTCRAEVSQVMQEEFQTQVIRLITANSVDDQDGVSKVLDEFRTRRSFEERVRAECGAKAIVKTKEK